MKKIVMLLTTLLISTSLFAVPPGLQGTPGNPAGKMPHGLQMQGKTPAGWSHGNKTGWYKTHRWHHGHGYTKHPVKTNTDVNSSVKVNDND